MPNYNKEWDDYRKRNRVYLIVSFLLVPGFFMCMALFHSTPFMFVKFLIILVIIIWALIGYILGMRVSYWKCPRCNKNYFGECHFTNQFKKKCVNCGLPKWESGSGEIDIA